MKTDVHEALKALAPIDHGEFPADAQSLDAQLEASLAEAHTLISSIPPPADLPRHLLLPKPPGAHVAALQNEWKPVKLSGRENALGLSMFKLVARDGRGTWFARRSIHTGVPFDRFEKGLQHEFSQPTAAEEGVRPTPIRGVGRDVLVRRQSSPLGKAEVLQLSAQFPGPSAPRDFVEGCLSSSAHPADLALARESGQQRADTEDDGSRPRQFTLISKPVLNHPGCEERPGYVRGTYESVEFIREIPFAPGSLSRSRSTPDISSATASNTTASAGPRPRGKTVGQAPVGRGEAAQDHAVDWIMITRSDPGGSVPKWMVERGTPGGIARDAERFLSTLLAAEATAEAQPPKDASEEPSQQQQQQQQNSAGPESTQKAIETKDLASAAAAQQLADVLASTETPLDRVREDSDTTSGGSGGGGAGYLSGAFESVALGMASLAQSMIYPPPPPTLPLGDDGDDDDETPPSPRASPEDNLSMTAGGGGDDGDDDSEPASTTWSFATCLDSLHETETASASASAGRTPPQGLSRTPSVSSAATRASSARAGQTAEERALAQFLREKQKLDEKLKKEEHKHTERERKMAEKHLRNMDKQESKYRRALAKANEKQAKDEDRRQREARKRRERDEKGRRREIDELKKVVEGLTRENLQLRERVDDLEAERRELPAKATFEKVVD